MQQFLQNPQAYTEMLRANPLFANNPAVQAALNNPELMEQQLRAAQQMMGGGGFAPQPPAGGYGYAQQQPPPAAAYAGAVGTIDQALLARLLGGPVGEAQTRLIAQSPEARRGLGQVLRGIQICRSTGLPLLSDIPNVDVMVNASLARLGGTEVPQPGPAPAPAAPPVQMSPEQRFGPQIAQMNEMGFNDNQRNVEALVATMGNVEQAINWLLSQ
jgi:hypothetical protein